MSLTIREAADICEKFRTERNSEECICHYLALTERPYEPIPVAFLPEPRLPEGHLPVNYEPTRTRKIWRF